MPHPTANRYLPRYMTQTEVRTFFRAIKDPRDRALFAVMYHYGLRVSEVELLTRDDVALDRNRIVVKRVKGGIWTERPLFERTRGLLRSYLTATRGEGSAPLFPGRSGPLRKRQIQSLFAGYRDQARLAGRHTCHSLRHAIATHLLDAGLSLEFVQDHLGHQSIRSTTIYARITDQHRVQVFRKLDASRWIVQPTDGPGHSEVE